MNSSSIVTLLKHSKAPWSPQVSISVSKFFLKKFILSVHVLWAFLLGSVVFLRVAFIFIGQIDQAITHYDSTGLTGSMSSHLLGEESPGVMIRGCKSHFWIRAKALIKSQPWDRSVLGPDSVLPQGDEWHTLPMLLSFHIDSRSSAKCYVVSQPPAFQASSFS